MALPARSVGGVDPLFANYFRIGAILNFVPAAFARPVPVEWVFVGAIHLLFIARVAVARRQASRQRAIDLEHFQKTETVIQLTDFGISSQFSAISCQLSAVKSQLAALSRDRRAFAGSPSRVLVGQRLVDCLVDFASRDAQNRDPRVVAGRELRGSPCSCLPDRRKMAQKTANCSPPHRVVKRHVRTQKRLSRWRTPRGYPRP